MASMLLYRFPEHPRPEGKRRSNDDSSSPFLLPLLPLGSRERPLPVTLQVFTCLYEVMLWAHFLGGADMQT